jgi:hypothetical protein
MFGGLSLGGSLGGVLGFIGQQQTNQKNWDIAQAANAASAQQAASQMAFQERMRETQYQTAVEDMKKAGLNPMLAYQHGGAGTPSGAMGQVSTAKVGNALGAGVAGYQAMQLNNAEVELKKAAEENTSASTIKTEADTIQTAVNIQKTLEDTKLSQQQYINMQELLKKLQEEILQIRASTKLSTAQEANVKENIAPSVDPYWYRDLKKGVSSAKQWASENMKYKGVSILPNFGGSKK